MDASLLVALSPWKVWEPFPRERVDAALARWPIDRPREWGHTNMVLIDFLTPAALMAVLTATLRGEAWAAGIFLRPPLDPRFDAIRVVEQAKRSRWGVAVRVDRKDPAARQVDALLGLHATLLRQRSPAMWRALDAKARHGTASAAAGALGCSQQAVSKHLRQSSRAATSQTRVVLEALLAARRPEDADH